MIQDFWTKHFLGTELLDSIARRETCPCFLGDSGLYPITDVEETVRLACRKIRAGKYQRVRVSSRTQPRGMYLAGGFEKPDAINDVRKQQTLVVDDILEECSSSDDLVYLKYLFLSVFQIDFSVNAYLGQDGSKGFGMHRDNHDVFIWQQSGRKLWEVRDQYNEQVILQVLLPPGGLLYIPQGYFHAAQTPAGEESLHLTMGFNRPWGDFREKAKKVLSLSQAA